MPTVDLVDETYLRAPLGTVAAAVHEQPRWTLWWPDLVPAVFMDRGTAGIRWNITGRLVGSMEIWLEGCEPPLDGVLLHFYLRADPTAAGSTTVAAPKIGRDAAAECARWARASKRNFWALKDELEAGLSRREGGSIVASASERGADRPVRGAHDGGPLS